MLIVNNLNIETDKLGYLLDFEQWTDDVALAIAKKEHLDLTDAHWQVIHFVREFYQKFNKSPAIRPLIKYLKKNMGEAKIDSLFLAKLFPEGAAKQSTKLAGLPKPTRCI